MTINIPPIEVIALVAGILGLCAASYIVLIRDAIPSPRPTFELIISSFVLVFFAVGNISQPLSGYSRIAAYLLLIALQVWAVIAIVQTHTDLVPELEENGA